MSALVPQADICCDPCESPSTTLIPGPPGEPGDDGLTPEDGTDAFTVTTEAFNMPAEAANVTVSVDSSEWMAIGQLLWIKLGAAQGTFEVITIPSISSVQIQNIEDTALDEYTDNSAPGTVFAVGAAVVATGKQGPAGVLPGDALLASNDLSDLNDPPTARGWLGLGTSAIVNTGVTDNLVVTVDQAAGLTTGDVVFATAAGIETQSDATARTSLGLGTAATGTTGVNDTEIPVIDDAGNLASGDVIFATATGVEGKTVAETRTALGIEVGYGLLGYMNAVDLNVANNDNAIAIGSGRYRIDHVTLESPSAAVTLATAGLFTAAGGGGTTLCADQALSGDLTAATKFQNLTEQAIVQTDVRSEGTIYLRTGTAEGSAMTVNLRIYGWFLDVV